MKQYDTGQSPADYSPFCPWLAISSKQLASCKESISLIHLHMTKTYYCKLLIHMDEKRLRRVGLSLIFDLVSYSVLPWVSPLGMRLLDVGLSLIKWYKYLLWVLKVDFIYQFISPLVFLLCTVSSSFTLYLLHLPFNPLPPSTLPLLLLKTELSEVS